MAWESSTRCRCSSCSRAADSRRLAPLEPGDQADAQDDPVHRCHPGEQDLLLSGVQVDADDCRAYDGVEGGDRRRPEQAEPQGGEDGGEERQGRKVSDVDEMVELAGDHHGQGDERRVHGAEEQQPPPRQRPAPVEPVVNEAVEDRQGDEQDNEQVLSVRGQPEPGPVGQLYDRDEPDEPSHPHRDPGGEQRHLRVGVEGSPGPPAQAGPEGVEAHGPQPGGPLRCPMCRRRFA